MTEEQVFLAALDLPDAGARSAYLNEACGGDAELCRKVEGLLAAHFKSGEFLDVPAAEQISAESDFGNAVTIQSLGLSADDVGAAMNDNDDASDLEFLAPTTRPDSLGRIGHYEVLQVLGKGGFGIVLRAFDDVLQRVVAIKVMSPQLAATSPARKRFLREARSSAAVRHENVVQVYEVGEQPLPYLVMEFIPGETLQQRLDRLGPLDVPETVRIGRQIAEGLSAAHAMDLIHRDIKPGNVLLEGGQFKVKITDFGVARAADDASMTQSGMIAGTPMYMAPEQALGHTLDQRVDLFSLGSVLYQMVTGRPPFRAITSVAVLKRVVEDTPRNIREVIPETPQWLCDIIARLHAKNPDDRFQSAREVAHVLADCEEQLKQNSRVRDFSRIPRSRTASSGRWKWVAAAVLTALLVFAGCYFLIQNLVPAWSNSAHGKVIAGWGTAVDPKRDCRIRLEGNALTMAIPGGHHNLNPSPGFNDVSAPRVLQQTGTDFQLVTRVDAFPVPAAGTTSNGRHSFYGAGLLLWQDEQNFARFMRAANGESGRVFVHFEVFRAGRVAASQALDIGNVPAFLRVIRTGDELLFSYGDDGMTWTAVEPGSPVRLARTLQVGVAGVNSTVKPFTPRFDRFAFAPQGEIKGSPVEPSQLAPLYEAHLQKPVIGWTTGAGAYYKCGFENSRYFIDVTPDTTRYQSVPAKAIDEFSCEVVGCITGSTASAWFLRVQNTTQEHSTNFIVNGNQELKIHNQISKNEWKRIGGARHEAIKPGNAFNTLRVVSRRGQFEVYLNGIRVCDPVPSDFVQTPVTFAVGVLGRNTASRAEFERFTLWPVEASPAAKMPFSDPDRRAAEYVLSIGGSVSVNEQPEVVRIAADLPPEPFRLTTVSMIENDQATDAGLANFKDCTNLKELSLGGANVSEAALAYFKDCTDLRLIALSFPVGDAGMLHFRECKDLQVLDLRGTKVSDAGLANFKDCTNLTTLYLPGPNVGDAGLAHFRDCKKLKKLQLQATQVSDTGLAHLQGLPLVDVRLIPKNFTRQGLAVLREMKDLKTIGVGPHADQVWPAAEFWERYDKGAFAPAPFTDAVLHMTFEKETFYQKDGQTWVRDLSGKGNDGLCEDIAFTPDGQVGGGLACQGGRLALSKSLINRQANYTIAMWVCAYEIGPDLSSEPLYLTTCASRPTELVYKISLPHDRTVAVNSWNAAKTPGNWHAHISPPALVPAGEWFFLAVTLSGGGLDQGELRVTVNDKVTSGSCQMVDSAVEDLIDLLGPKMTDGVLDEVAVFQRALSDEEIAAVRALGLADASLK